MRLKITPSFGKFTRNHQNLTPCRPFSGWYCNDTALLKAGAWDALGNPAGGGRDDDEDEEECVEDDEGDLELIESCWWHSATHCSLRFSNLCLKKLIFAIVENSRSYLKQNCWRWQIASYFIDLMGLDISLALTTVSFWVVKIDWLSVLEWYTCSPEDNRLWGLPTHHPEQLCLDQVSRDRVILGLKLWL